MVNDIDKMIDVTTGDKTIEEANAPEYTAVYQVYPHSKIPVSKATGTFWEGRYKEAVGFLDKLRARDRWDEAIAYYQNDQSSRSNKRRQLSEVSKASANDPQYATENVVFTNISALVPAIYAKNPDTEFTATKEENENTAKLYEALVDTIMKRKFAPGINIKPKLKRATCTSLLTNICYLELSYCKKEDSSEEALVELQKCSKELDEAKTSREIEIAESKLVAIETKISLLASAGPKCRVVQPKYVLKDPSSIEPDLSDAGWVMVGEHINTAYLKAVYGTRNGKDVTSEWKSLYEPTHSLGVNDTGGTNAQGHDQQINSFSLTGEHNELDMSQGGENYGFKNKDDFTHNALTLVWYVWDKTTRRVMMFHDKDWKHPIWVWDDPYRLSRFFPLFPLSFYTDPTDPYGRSEVMYYLDQQDEINMSNAEVARMKHWVSTKVFYNTELTKDRKTIEKFLSGQTDSFVHGIEIPEGKRIQDVIGTFPAPSAQFAEMFSNQRNYDAINRLSSVTPIMQNVQFKTNTTNKAVESYESSTTERLDEKIDAIEEVVGDIGWAIIEMCIQFMSEDVVRELVPGVLVDKSPWINVDDPKELIHNYNFTVVGGSTLKPTSKVKKEQAMQLGQVLGQFAKGSPAVVIVMLKALERAFSEDVVITENEWEMVVQSTMQSIQRQEQQGQGQQPQQPQNAPAQGQGNQETAAVFKQVEQMLMQLPPEAQQAIGNAVSQGVPLSEIMQKVMGMQQPQPQQPPIQ